MSDYDLYQTRLNASGNTNKDRKITKTKRAILKSFKNSPSYYSVSINGVTTDAHITDSSETRDEKNILTQSTSLIKSGDIVLWNSENWLTLIVDFQGGIYYRGTIRKCVSTLKWKNSSGVQKEAQFTLKTDTLSNFGITEGRIVTLGNERRQIIVQSNVDTQAIKKDQRFIFDNRTWKVTVIDGLITGLISLTLEEDTTNTATDDTANRIANNTGTSGGGFW